VNGTKVTVQREFIVHVPNDYDANFEYAVVFAFHGHGGSSTQWEASLGDLIDQYKFIGVYPKGYKDAQAKDDDGNAAQTSWNLGTEISTADDVVFVNDVIKKLESITSDASKRFALGSSNGAALSHFLAANAKTKIFNGIGTLVSGLIKTTLEGNTAITIPVSGNTYQYGLLQNSIPLSVVTIFGMSDTIIPYWGGEAKTGAIIYSAEDSIREWAKLAGCSDYNTKEVKTFESNSTTIIDLSQYFQYF
jgi:poly(3-hydroxybutyrate) depolymerase